MLKIVKDKKALRKKSKEVDIETGKKTLTKLKIVMKQVGDKGIGLCGPQIGLYERVIYINYNNQIKLSMINPEIISESKETSKYKEGCLSLPETLGNNNIEIERSKRIKVKFQDSEGVTNILKFDGLIGRAIQHEVDHLQGILIIDK
jgi:peptide deformylase